MKRFSIAVFVMALWAGCSELNDTQIQRDTTMPAKTIEQVQEAHTEHLMSIPGVVGTAIGESGRKPCIKVLVSRKTAEIEKGVPKFLDGYPVVVEVTGEFKALDSDS